MLKKFLVSLIPSRPAPSAMLALTDKAARRICSPRLYCSRSGKRSATSATSEYKSTAFCHTDYTHTPPGVLLRWISGKPSFVSNSHFPHDGLITLAHCAAPRRMNGRDFEPTRIMTHYESDYGAACRTHYTKDQVVTAVVPNLACTKWQGFRGKIIATPSYPACRSQMEILIEGDWKRLVREMQGFHTQVVYGDYLREVGYALKKLGGQIQWQSYSEV